MISQSRLIWCAAKRFYGPCERLSWGVVRALIVVCWMLARFVIGSPVPFRRRHGSAAQSDHIVTAA
jgi:hypothetical protein